MTLPTWGDRYGRSHQERPPTGGGDLRMQRVAAVGVVPEGSPQNPLIERDPDDHAQALWTWVVDAPEAKAVVLWTNPVFDHEDVARAEFVRIPGSDVWTISLRLPAALRAAYRIGVWREEAPPPWRVVSGRRDVILAARGASSVDPSGTAILRTGPGEEFSVAAGPDAPAETWRAGRGRMLEDLALPGDHRAWVYRPPVRADPTPLLVLFDGAVWKEMGLCAALDAAIAAGEIPPLHVVLIDSFEGERRYAELGVPSHQVDVLIDEVLPRVRSGWNVDPRGAATIVAGQSLGGLASLWALALSRGEVGHAIAQSASIWRFDLVDAILGESAWRTLHLEAGTFEAGMLADAEELARTLRDDPRCGDRTVEVTAFEAGHDWAVWRTNLLRRLALLLPQCRP